MHLAFVLYALVQPPVVIKVHVALCDNTIIRCGGRGLGDGDSLRTNLYWATSEGLRGWITAQHKEWRLAAEQRFDGEDRLARVVWERPGRARMVVDVWRGRRIDAAVRAFVADLDGDGHDVVAWVGHNRWMDYDSFAWPARRSDVKPKRVIAIACHTRSYLKEPLLRAGHEPLVLTNDFVMASGAALMGGVNALLDGASLDGIRTAATAHYARGQQKDPARLSKVFVNASSPRW